MTTRLTLSINQEIAKKAKRISRMRGKSVSKMIEEYIGSLPEKELRKSTSIREISNMLKEGIAITDNLNYKEFIRDNRSKDYKKTHQTSKD